MGGGEVIYREGATCAKALGLEGGCQREEGRALGQSVMRRKPEEGRREQPGPVGLTALAGRAGITQASLSSTEGFVVRERPDQLEDLRSCSSSSSLEAGGGAGAQ